MSGIEYFRYDDDAIVSILANAFASKNLVPVIGAGFTVGCGTAAKRKVPSGTQFREEMLTAIMQHRDLSPEKQIKLREKKFSEVADFYFNKDWVPVEVVRSHLEESFKGVSLTEEKIDFLTKIDWPYLYTLNIDDAIEKNSNYDAALPYNNNLSIRSREQLTVFKLHGDIGYELRHDDNRLVFRRADYLQSLTENQRMLEFLKLDLLNKNIIYIGCSLKDELDISFVIAKQNIEHRRNVRNITFLTEKLDEIDEQEYLNIGVNCVILFDKDRYDQIYELINRAYQNSATITKSLQTFAKPIRVLNKTKSENEDFLISGVVEVNHGTKKYTRVLPHYFSPRDAEAKINASLKINEVTVIVGGRVSGKTLAAYGVLNGIKDRAIYIVDSTHRVDGKTMLQLLGQKNSIIFFDSTSYSYDDLKTIERLRTGLLGRDSRLLLCCEKNNNEVDQVLGRAGEKTGFIFLDNKLSPKELATLNSRAIESSLPTFTVGKYILDKIYNVFSIIGEENKISKLSQSKDLFKILYVLSVKNQMTGQEIHFSGIAFDEISKLVRENEPFIQFGDVEIGEYTDHTSYKVFTHASSWVVAALRECYKSKGVDWCVDALIELFTNLYDFDRKIVIDLRKFDSINFVFTSGNLGASSLILKVYDRLESLEGAEAEFFVQKAKAYYNMYHGNDLGDVLSNIVIELNKALTWAKTDHNMTTIRNINHVKALVCLRKAVETTNPSSKDVMDALESVLLSINSDNNASYVKNFLTGEIRGADYLRDFQDTILNNSSKFPILLTAKGKIQELNSKVIAAKDEIRRHQSLVKIR